MTIPIEELWSMPEPALLGAYHGARRQFVEKKFARDTQRARLEWLRAKMFVGSSGGVTDRKMAVDVSEELARKGQELREMTRDLDLIKIDRHHRHGDPAARGIGGDRHARRRRRRRRSQREGG
jgi:hypothetical protein